MTQKAQRLRDGTSLINLEEVRQAYSWLIDPEQVIELRLLEATLRGGERYKQTLGGFFDNVDDLIQELRTIQSALGQYITIQQLDTDLLHRAKNKIIPLRKDNSTPDKNVTHYRWLPLDCDIVRKVKLISSNDEEHERALRHAQQVKQILTELDWPAPIEADSGNGAHLLYHIDLPNTDENVDLIKRVLAGIAARTDTEAITLDQTVYNPARIWKLYGTLACKGDNTEERPHRMARLLTIPDNIQIVTHEMLEQIAAPKEVPQAHAITRYVGHPEPTLEEWLRVHNIRTHPVNRHGVDYLILDNGCVFNPEHQGDDAAVFVAPSGRWSYHCFHDGCGDQHWQDFRELVAPKEHKTKSHSFEEIHSKVTEAIQDEDIQAVSALIESIVKLDTSEQLIIDDLIRQSPLSTSGYKKLKKETIEQHRQTQKASLGGSLYGRDQQGMFYWTVDEEGNKKEVYTSNFAVEMIRDIHVDDGSIHDDGDQDRYFELQTSDGKQFKVSSHKFKTCDWVNRFCSTDYYVLPGRATEQHFCNAIKACSKPVQHTIFSHTGWTKINGQMVYLHAGGSISGLSGPANSLSGLSANSPLNGESACGASLEGKEKPISGLSGPSGPFSKPPPTYSVKFSGNLNRYNLVSAQTGVSLQEATKRSLQFLDITRDTVTVPLYCANWRSLLGRINLSLHIWGKSGRGKTALAAIIQQHHGHTMESDQLPIAWKSTENALEDFISRARDTVVVIDEFKPVGSKSRIDEWHAKADSIFQAIGNGAFRARLDSNLDQRPERRPGALVISTGEDIPRNGQSGHARSIQISMNEPITLVGTAEQQKLSVAQKEAASGLYTQVTAAYIEWLAPQIEQIQADMPAEIELVRDTISLPGHPRAGMNMANLIVGMQHFLAFAVAIGAISDAEAKGYLDRCTNALIDVADEAAEENYDDNPSQQWLRLLRAAIASQQAHLSYADGGYPGIGYGWKKTIQEEKESYVGGGLKIGWIVGDDIYLIPTAAYNAANAAGHNGSTLSIQEQTLRKHLDQDHILASTSSRQRKTESGIKEIKEYTVRKSLEKTQQPVLHIKKATLFLSDSDDQDNDPEKNHAETQTGKSTSDRHEVAPEDSLVDSTSKESDGAPINTQTGSHEEIETPPPDQESALRKEADILLKQIDERHVPLDRYQTIPWQSSGRMHSNEPLTKLAYHNRVRYAIRVGHPDTLRDVIEAMRYTLEMST
jgi:hypothetical protein